ncbi:vigilin-like [Sipha flava]|uniref:Vigilin-like n=1 Tax=Sipha flava TaxID=143950 RepID=A0A8B8FAX8_9HEMI|nr:vigilin-like [Sipha flava]
MITDIGKVIEEHVEINEKNHGTLVVKQKECIHELKNECGYVKIEFPNLGAGDRIVISDSKANVALSKQRLSDHAKVLKNIIEVTMNVPPKYHDHFVAHHSEVINQISGKHNGVTIKFPQASSNSSQVLIKGHKDYVEKVKNEINNIIIDLRRSSGAVDAMHRGLRDLGPSIQKKTNMKKNRSLH